MKYSQVNWSKWDDQPDECTFSDWVQVRKMKRLATTQTALNRAAKHINKLYQMGISADDAIAICCERGWGGIEADWVLNYMRSQQQPALHTQNIRHINTSRSTRETTLEQELSDRSWAD